MSLLQIYIVDDSKIIRDSLTATLEELSPVRVIGSAEDEATALHWLGEPAHRVDLVIVDLFLKAGSGLGVLKATKAHRRDGKVIVLSNYASQAMRHKCLALGADEVFDKSQDIDALLTYCRQLASDGKRAPRAIE
jgi:DNA-binding NarL/FixJ family response regulator